MSDILMYLLTGALFGLLIPLACLQTANYLARPKRRRLKPRTEPWLLAFALLSSLFLANCSGGSKDGPGAIVDPKSSGSEITSAGGGSALGSTGESTAGSTGGGATGGGTGGEPPSLGEPPIEGDLPPELILQVIQTTLN